MDEPTGGDDVENYFDFLDNDGEEVGNTLSGDSEKDWDLFFPNEPLVTVPYDDPRFRLMNAARQYFSGSEQLSECFATHKSTLEVDFADFSAGIRSIDPTLNFVSLFYDRPDHAISSINLSIFGLYRKLAKDPTSRDLSAYLIDRSRHVRVRFYNFERFGDISNLKSDFVGKFIAIPGTIIRTGPVMSLPSRIMYTCKMCGNRFLYPVNHLSYEPPTECLGNPQCRNKWMFDPDLLESEMYDSQQIRIQEILEAKMMDGGMGRVPKTLDCELRHDLIDSVLPGDVVSLNGIIRESPIQTQNNNSQSMYRLYLEVHSIEKKHTLSVSQASNDLLTLQDMMEIKKIVAEQNQDLFKVLVNSFAKDIFGNEIIKAGFILTLFGGSTNPDGAVSLRSNSHMLVIGDPGLGKSQMLRFLSTVSPRSVYVSGNSTTGAGLTISMSRDTETGGFIMDAGAAVLSDNGVCCIDEFDKMKGHHSSLLEVMEQQSVSFAKAGVVSSLPARCSIVAAANPIGGHYNNAKTVSENIKLHPAILSRFDLVFIIQDKPNAERDRFLSKKVIEYHIGTAAGSNRPPADNYSKYSQLFTPTVDKAGTGVNTSRLVTKKRTLREKITVRPGQTIETISVDLFRKYVKYAKTYVNPVLTKEAKELIKSYYIKLRKRFSSVEGLPCTTRQLESIIRLSEARAKLELRQEVLESDVLDVIELMDESLFDIFKEDLDLGSKIPGALGGKLVGISNKNLAMAFIKRLAAHSAETGKKIFTIKEMRTISDSLHISDNQKFSQIVSGLNNQGYLIKMGPSRYKLTI